MMMLLLSLSMNSHAIKKRNVIVGGLAGYGAYQFVKGLFTSETQVTHNYVNRSDYNGDIRRLEVAFNTLDKQVISNSAAISELQLHVDELDQRVGDVEQRMTELENDIVGKKVELQQLGDGLVINRSVIDSNEMDRIGNKQYDQGQVECRDTMRRALKSLIKSDSFKNVRKELNIGTINLSVVDSRNAIEDMDKSVSLNYIPQGATLKSKRTINGTPGANARRGKTQYVNGMTKEFATSVFGDTDYLQNAHMVRFTSEKKDVIRVYYTEKVWRNGYYHYLSGDVPGKWEYKPKIDIYDVEYKPDLVSLDIIAPLNESANDKGYSCVNPIAGDLFASLLSTNQEESSDVSINDQNTNIDSNQVHESQESKSSIARTK